MTYVKKEPSYSSVPDDLPILLDVPTVARLTGLNQKAVRDNLSRGVFKGVKLGGVWRVNRDELMEKLGVKCA